MGDVAVLRYATSGERDSSFGAQGVATLRVGEAFAAGTMTYGASALVATPEGVFVGFSVFGGDRGFAVWKLLPNGRPNPSIGDGGLRTVPIGSVAELHDLAWSPDSRTLTAGGWNPHRHDPGVLGLAQAGIGGGNRSDSAGQATIRSVVDHPMFGVFYDDPAAGVQ